MPWVRLDEHAMDHPKVASLSDGAFRLWVAGLSYCQKFLTNGFISTVALKALRPFSPKRRQDIVSARLWDEAENGVQVHDYLDWNDSREKVLNAREAAKQRVERHRDKRVSNAVTNGATNAHAPVGVCSGSFRKVQKTSSSDHDAVLGERAGTFVNETYPALYAKYRNGARYVSRPALDFQEALQLCRTWDDERLRKIAIVFLTTDHEFAEKGSRTMAQFRSLASWCDSKLKEKGIA